MKYKFADYVRFREDASFGDFSESGEGDGLEKMNHFMLLALSNPDIKSSLYPILQQISGQDETGVMQDLLKRINLDELSGIAKKMLKDKKNIASGDGEGEKRIDMVKPALADTGKGMEGEE